MARLPPAAAAAAVLTERGCTVAAVLAVCGCTAAAAGGCPELWQRVAQLPRGWGVDHVVYQGSTARTVSGGS
jgi:hypothetical protein